MTSFTDVSLTDQFADSTIRWQDDKTASQQRRHITFMRRVVSEISCQANWFASVTSIYPLTHYDVTVAMTSICSLPSDAALLQSRAELQSCENNPEPVLCADYKLGLLANCLENDITHGPSRTTVT